MYLLLSLPIAALRSFINIICFARRNKISQGGKSLRVEERTSEKKNEKQILSSFSNTRAIAISALPSLSPGRKGAINSFHEKFCLFEALISQVLCDSTAHAALPQIISFRWRFIDAPGQNLPHFIGRRKWIKVNSIATNVSAISIRACVAFDCLSTILLLFFQSLQSHRATWMQPTTNRLEHTIIISLQWITWQTIDEFIVYYHKLHRCACSSAYISLRYLTSSMELIRHSYLWNRDRVNFACKIFLDRQIT